ncbi:acyltransferase family protein [Vibrio cyclitrophicus]
MNSRDFERINCLRFPLVFLVLFLHAFPHIDTSSLSSIEVYIIRDFMTNGISRLAVPIFFCMSGFLFFKGCSYNVKLYESRLKSRLISVFFPFLIWNSIVFSLFYIIYSMPIFSSYSSGLNNYTEFSVTGALKKVLGFGETPASYQLWFLRDLIYLFFFSPIIYLMVSNRFSFLLTSFIFFFIYIFSALNNDYFSFTALFYFFVGGGLSYFSKGLFIFDKYKKTLFFLFVACFSISSFIGHEDFSSPILRFTILVGVFATFSFTSIEGRGSKLLSYFSSFSVYSFWLFIIHEPLLTILFKVATSLSGERMGFFAYFFIPIFVFILSIVTYKILAQYAPLVLKVLNGGRIESKVK